MAGHSRSQSLLLLGLGNDRRLAVPLALVDRLEEAHRADVEWTGGREVLQYRGGILPLLRLSELLPGREPAIDPDPLQVVVCHEGSQSAGLVVDRILDVVEVDGTEKRSSPGLGLLGSVIIQSRVTDLLDVPGLLSLALPELAGRV